MSRTGFFVASTIAFGCVGGLALADQTSSSAAACAARDLQAITTIENHGVAQDVPSRSLYGAALTIERARAACRDGRLDEAVALYDLILTLGPVVAKAAD